jgi:hypothetical protein
MFKPLMLFVSHFKKRMRDSNLLKVFEENDEFKNFKMKEA